MLSHSGPRPLRFVRPAPAREVAPEVAAWITPLVQLQGDAAARLRRRRSSPEGWVPVYMGLVARTFSAKHGRWLEAEHASHWAWPGYPAAAGRMQQHRQHGATTLILEVWAPVWSDPGRGIVEVGHPVHYENFVRSLCWVISAEDVPDTWARKPQGRAAAGLEWRFAAGREEARLPVPDLPGKRVLPPQGRYASGMERPRSPLPHAKEVLAAYYVEHGILPSVQLLAELLGGCLPPHPRTTWSRGCARRDTWAPPSTAS